MFLDQSYSHLKNRSKRQFLMVNLPMDVLGSLDFVVDVVKNFATTTRGLFHVCVVGMFWRRRFVDLVEEERVFDQPLMRCRHNVGEFETATIIVRLLALLCERNGKIGVEESKTKGNKIGTNLYKCPLIRF